MPEKSTSPYDAADLNMSRVAAYASRVARETRAMKQVAISAKRRDSVPVQRERRTGVFGRTETYTEFVQKEVEVELVGPHWPLLVLMGNSEVTDYPRKVQEWHQKRFWVLTADGMLVYVDYWHEFTQYAGMAGSWDYGSTVNAMTRENVLEMDREHPRYERSNRQKEHWWGNLNPGRLRSHAPGVGVSVALRNLLAAG